MGVAAGALIGKGGSIIALFLDELLQLDLVHGGRVDGVEQSA